MSTTSTTSTSTTDAPAGFTAAEQLDWTLGLLADPMTKADELEARFSASFLAAVPPDVLTATLEELTGQYEIVEDHGSDVALDGIIQRESDGLRLSFVLAVDPADAGRVIELGFRPAGPQIDGEIAPDAVDQAFADAAAMTSYGIFEVTDGRCEALHQAGTDQPLAIASQFKLWVLIAVAEQIETGAIGWEDLVTVTDDQQSAPNGPLPGLADGEQRTVSELATLMISISDNTATDLLIDHVGREHVESAMVDTMVGDPSRNLPLLSTREAFLLKLDPTHAAYPDLSPGEQRIYLDTVLSDPALRVPALNGPYDADDSLPPAPWQIDELEWFATPIDMCQAMVRLAELADDPRHTDHITTALSTNPGAQIDTDRWPTVWFKGGSEPGVLASTWYVVDADGSSFVASGALNDADHDFGNVAGASAMQLMLPLLESRPSGTRNGNRLDDSNERRG